MIGANRPVCREWPDGRVDLVAPDEWIDFEDQTWLYGARGTHPCSDRDTADRIRALIDRLGVRDELIRRMGEPLKYATPPRDGYGGRAQP